MLQRPESIVFRRQKPESKQTHHDLPLSSLTRSHGQPGLVDMPDDVLDLMINKLQPADRIRLGFTSKSLMQTMQEHFKIQKKTLWATETGTAPPDGPSRPVRLFDIAATIFCLKFAWPWLTATFTTTSWRLYDQVTYAPLDCPEGTWVVDRIHCGHPCYTGCILLSVFIGIFLPGAFSEARAYARKSLTRERVRDWATHLRTSRAQPTELDEVIVQADKDAEIAPFSLKKLGEAAAWAERIMRNLSTAVEDNNEEWAGRCLEQSIHLGSMFPLPAHLCLTALRHDNLSLAMRLLTDQTPKDKVLARAVLHATCSRHQTIPAVFLQSVPKDAWAAAIKDLGPGYLAMLLQQGDVPRLQSILELAGDQAPQLINNIIPAKDVSIIHLAVLFHSDAAVSMLLAFGGSLDTHNRQCTATARETWALRQAARL